MGALEGVAIARAALEYFQDQYAETPTIWARGRMEAAARDVLLAALAECRGHLGEGGPSSRAKDLRATLAVLARAGAALESCELHAHSIFHPCPNGLLTSDYLAKATS